MARRRGAFDSRLGRRLGLSPRPPSLLPPSVRTPRMDDLASDAVKAVPPILQLDEDGVAAWFTSLGFPWYDAQIKGALPSHGGLGAQLMSARVDRAWHHGRDSRAS